MSAPNVFVVQRAQPMSPAEFERAFGILNKSYKIVRSLTKHFAFAEGQGHKNPQLQVTFEDNNKMSQTRVIDKSTLSTYSKMLTAAVAILVAEYKKAHAAIGKAAPALKESQRFRNGTLYNRNFNAFFYNIVAAGGLGSELSGKAVDSAPLAEFIFARPADQDGQAPPDQPLAGVASPNLLITIFNIVSYAAQLYKFSVFNHAPGTFNPAQPEMGLLPTASKNQSIGDDHLNGSHRGLPANVAAPLLNQFAALEQSSLNKVRDHYAIRRAPGNLSKAADGPATAIVFVTKVGNVETRRAGNYLALLDSATKPEDMWATLDPMGNPQPKVPAPVPGQVVQMVEVPITKENILNHQLPLSSRDFGYLVLTDGQGGVIEMPNTVAPQLGAITKLETGSDAFNREIAVRAASARFAQIFAPYQAQAQAAGMDAGTFFYQRHFAEPLPTAVAIYEEAASEQFKAYYAGTYNEYQAKGKEPPRIIVNVDNLFREVARKMIEKIPEAAPLANLYNGGNYEAVIRSVDPATWLGMKLQYAQSYYSRVLRERADAAKSQAKATGVRSGRK